MKKLWLLSLFGLAFLIPFVYADTGDVVDISELPQRLATALNIPLFAGQILASMLLMSFFLFPTIFISLWAKAKDITIPCLFVGIGTLCLCVAIGWFPVWILLLLSLLTAIMLAGKMRGWVSGS